MSVVKSLIDSLELEPHPEGGWYRETWRGPEMAGGRAVGTAIHFMLTTRQRSHWHRIDAHELWIWQAGDPLILLTAPDEASQAEKVVLGRSTSQGQLLQHVIEPFQWQAAQPVSSSAGYTLVTCVVTPGFEFEHFELAPEGWSPGRTPRSQIFFNG